MQSLIPSKISFILDIWKDPECASGNCPQHSIWLLQMSAIPGSTRIEITLVKNAKNNWWCDVAQLM